MLQPITPTHSNSIQSQQQRIDSLLHNSKATNTHRAYQSDWTDYTTFCTNNALNPLPATTQTILLYLSHLSIAQKYATIKRKLSSISKAHKAANLPNPTNTNTIRDLMDGIARTNGNKSTPKKALILSDLSLMIDVIDVNTLTGKRDKTMILLGFTTASRRSELISINVQDISYTQEGIDILIKEDKTQQYITKSILYANNNYCPIQALKDWLLASNISKNSIFRAISKTDTIGERLDGRTVANTIKKYAELAGLDPALYSGHSLRSGMLTSGSQEGYNDAALMAQSGHKSRDMIDRYTQQGNRFKNNITSILSKL